MRQIAIYGKGGIGKSTITANLSAAFANSGYKVIQIGCDPKHDSTKNLIKGKPIKPVLDHIRDGKNESDITLDEISVIGYKGIVCIEAGGPEPGIGCAGRGIITVMNVLEQLNAFREIKPDIVLYDVLGDVVCGGFAMPIREGYAQEVYTK